MLKPLKQFGRHVSYVVCAAAVLAAGCHPGAKSGRRGNSLYERGSYSEATSAYQNGIEDLLTNTEEEPKGTILSGLLNNAGASLVRSENYAEARDNFVSSVTTAEQEAGKARGYYNAGFAAYNEDEKRLSADYFRKALLTEPNNADAKYNYELVMRELKQQNQDKQDQSGGQPPPPPSAYAKELKAQAEELVNQRRYSEAAKLMNDGLQIDPSVQAFQEFIDRISAIANINGG